MTEELVEKKKHGLSFPSAWLITFILLMIAAVLTYIIPAGAYSTLIYNGETEAFTITAPSGEESEVPATQETLDQYGIKTDLDKLVDGTIWKPIAIPGSYEKVDPQHQNFVDVIMSIVNGIYETIDIMFFVLILGGCLGILNYSGAFTAGIGALSRATQGKEYILIVAMTFLISLGGTTFGMAEETMALYPVLVPVFLAAKYDALVCVTSIYMGSTIGCMFSTVNPFSAVIASNTAGVDFTSGIYWRMLGLVAALVIVVIYIIRYANKVRKDPTKSIVYDERFKIEAAFQQKQEAQPLKPQYSIALIVFLACFAVMIYGVINLEWWFGEMTAVFIVGGVIIGIILGLPEKVFFEEFISGASALVGVGMIIGFSRSVNLLLESGRIQDTILQGLISGVGDMNPYFFLVILMFIFMILGFFINSSSALAVLTIPIMAPLADAVGLPRELVISAYIYGLGIITAVSPCSLALITCEMVKVPYVKYVRFLMPLLGLLTILGVVMLLLQASLG
ncbi:YfcC family protein [Anoxybacterium hadale]|uniref:YfcC family protein n=1 Tax=Anoxybacterium hadale TaxID=3408580 RepID=A0ACD1A6D5_9FIRM|nr:YfcC family protein [Clostridiales bacterium]